MYCGKCGDSLSEEDKYCPKCSAEVTQPSAINHADSAQAPTSAPLNRGKKLRIALFVTVALIGSLFVCGLVGVLVGVNKDVKPKKRETTETATIPKQATATATQAKPKKSVDKNETSKKVDPALNEDLVKAVEARNLEEVHRLLDAGADLNARVEGLTPLHVAAREGGLDITRLLVEHGASVNARDDSNWTPLHRSSAWKDQPEITIFLLNKGADVNARSDEGWTPLHLAAQYENLKTATILLERGVDVNARDRDGHTAIHIPTLTGNTEMIDLLKSHGGIE